MPIDLLALRFKCIAPFPGMLRYGMNVDDILLGEDGVWENQNTKRHVSVWPYHLKDYPANFKKLEWYEDIDFKDWPKYVKWEEDIIFKVLNWRTNPNTSQLDGVYTDYGFLFIKDIIPATKEQFESYQSTINKPVK